jgi:hypothetical protein
MREICTSGSVGALGGNSQGDPAISLGELGHIAGGFWKEVDESRIAASRTTDS